MVNQTGRDACASYGIIPPGEKDVSFGKHIQSSGKVPVYVRDEVFEIEELRYAAHVPISVKNTIT